MDLIKEGHILWTHVTSPFVTGPIYDEMIAAYRTALAEGYDSLMATTLIHGFLWDRNGPINYDRSVEKWPRTQTLLPLHEINSAAFLTSAEVYAAQDDRIGKNPFKFGMDKITGMDVDWPADFLIAESMVLQKIAEL